MTNGYDEHTVSRYPLEWPAGWKRTSQGRRTHGAFRHFKQAMTVAVSTQRLEYELDRLGAKNPVLSSNISLRLDGRPRSDENPSDPGIAVYFRFRGKATVLACDRYYRAADNIAAIAAHIDALRRIERYGVGTIEQALAGYRALPADTAADWRQVFGFPAGAQVTADDVNARFREMARDKHPDRGGTDEGMAHLNRARDYAFAELEPVLA